MIYFSTLLLSLFLTIAVMPLARKFCIMIRAVDIPGGRKIHTCPVPKGGGMAMAVGSLVPVLLWTIPDHFVKAVLLGAALVLLCGVVDDLKPLNYKIKFAAQLAGALIVVFYGGVEIRNLGLLLPEGVLLPNAVAIPLTILVIVGVTNAINLSDGLDGLAGGICLLSFCCIGYLAYRYGNTRIALLSMAVSGAIFGFLRFNTYPATLFMGDAGSELLGFLAICLALGLTQGDTPLSPLLPLIILGFPILDTLAVMVGRMSNGESPFHADNKHFHHRLLKLGFFHTEAVMIIYLIQAGLVTAAFFLRFHSEWLLLLGYAAFASTVTAGFMLADRTGFQFKRYPIIDKVIKGKLKVLRERALIIGFSARGIEIGLPLLILASCLLTDRVPFYFSYIAFGLLGMILLLFFLRKVWLSGGTRLALYLLIPTVIYLGESSTPHWLSGLSLQVYNGAFVALALLIILTLKFTRRKKGFKISPMDLLILFIAVIAPYLPDRNLEGFHMGIIATKVILLFFGYEVYVGELRGNVKRSAVMTIIALAIIGVKALIP